MTGKDLDYAILPEDYSDSQKKRDVLRQIANKGKACGCALCDEKRIPCLSYHHTDPKSKKKDISYMVSKKYSVLQLLAEIDKCVVLCHNCHALVEAGEISL